MNKPKIKLCKQCDNPAAPKRRLCLQCIYKKEKAERKEKAKIAKEKKANREAIKKEQAKLKKQVSTKTLDTLWSRCVKILANNVCEYSGSSKHLQSHHIYSRRDYRLRWDVNNGCCLSAKAHQFSTEFSAHQTPLDFKDWITEKRGEKWLEDLREKRNNPKKPDREAIRKELIKIIEKKENNM